VSRPPPGVETVELTIEGLAVGGDGVGRDATGRVYFVPQTAPGDRVRARITGRYPRYGRAEVEQLLAASSARVPPRCGVFGRCGGCTWQHLHYATQIDAKRSFLHECLSRVGGVRALPEIEFLASPEPYGYRGRARLFCTREQVGFRERRSRRVCATEACPVLAPALESVLKRLPLMRSSPPLDPPETGGEFELTLGKGGTVRCAPFETHARPVGPQIEVGVGTDHLRVSPGVFVQGNALLLPALVDTIAEVAGYGEAALELYAGAGFLSVRLARRFARLQCVEASVRACEDLGYNLARIGRADAGVVCAPVRPKLLRRWLHELQPDVVVLDPPRAGLGRAGARALALARPKRIVYLACDPATWARDLGVICRAGYHLQRVVGFDLFPQTPHVEGLGVLEPGDSPGRS